MIFAKPAIFPGSPLGAVLGAQFSTLKPATVKEPPKPFNVPTKGGIIQFPVGWQCGSCGVLLNWRKL